MKQPALALEPRMDVPALVEGEIHIWSLRVERTASARAVGIAARAELERLLCAYGNVPTPPVIERGPHGKPFAPSLGDLDFNLSHAGHDALLAFARAQPLGVDIERFDRRLATGELARRFFASDEADALQRLPAEAQQRCFLQLWTQKEAVLKAFGQGLGFGLNRLAFAIGGDGEVGDLLRIAEVAGRAEEWHLRRLFPGDDLVAAVAWRGADRSLRLFMRLP